MSQMVREIQSKPRFHELETAYNFLDRMMISEGRNRLESVFDFIHTLGLDSKAEQVLLEVIDQTKRNYFGPESGFVKRLKTIIFGSLINIGEDSEEVRRETRHFVTTIADSLLAPIYKEAAKFDEIDVVTNLDRLHESLLHHFVQEGGFTEDRLNRLIDDCEETQESDVLLQTMKRLVQSRTVDYTDDHMRFEIMKIATDDQAVLKRYEAHLNQEANLATMKRFYKECLLLPHARLFLRSFAEEKLKHSFSPEFYHRLFWLIKMSDKSLAKQMVFLSDDIQMVHSVAESSHDLLKSLLPGDADQLLAFHDQVYCKGLDLLRHRLNCQPILQGAIDAFLDIEIESESILEFLKEYSKFTLFFLLNGAEGDTFETSLKSLISEAYEIIANAKGDYERMAEQLIDKYLPEEVIPALVTGNHQVAGLKRQLRKPLKKLLETHFPGVETSHNILFDNAMTKKSLFHLSGFVSDFLEGRPMDFSSVEDDKAFIAKLADQIIAVSGGKRDVIQNEIRQILPYLDNTIYGKQLILRHIFRVPAESIPNTEDEIDQLLQDKVVELFDQQVPLILRLFFWPLMFLVHWRIRSVVRRILRVKDRDNFPQFIRLLAIESLRMIHQEVEEEPDQPLERVAGNLVGSRYNPIKKLEAKVAQHAVRYVKVPEKSLYDLGMENRSKLIPIFQKMF